jgi:hypothetical protein
MVANDKGRTWSSALPSNNETQSSRGLPPLARGCSQLVNLRLQLFNLLLLLLDRIEHDQTWASFIWS